MFRSFNKVILWSLIIALTIIAGAGEGLHFIPGCGHGLKVGDQVMWIGVSADELGCNSASADPAENEPAHIERSHDLDIPIWDEDGCPICSLLAQYFSTTDVAAVALVMPFAHDLPVAPSSVAFSDALCFCLARAPPLA